MSETSTSANLIDLAADIVSAYVSNNTVSSSDLPGLIGEVYAALQRTSSGVAPEPMPEPLKPAVPVKKSVTPDYIVCLEDGKKLKMLKRHLMTHYNMTPEEYRVRWNLPADYPMVAPNYAEKRRELAKKIGLGRKSNARRGRKPKTAAA